MFKSELVSPMKFGEASPSRLSLSAVICVVLLSVHLVLCIPYVTYLGIYDAGDTPWTVNGSQYPFDPVLLLNYFIDLGVFF